MLDHHGVAVAPLASGFEDLAVSGGLDRSADGGCVVDALVCADLVQDRVAAAREKRELIRAKSTGVRMNALRMLEPSAR